MELGYEIHSYMTATQIDKTLCSQAHPYIPSQKFPGLSPVLVAGLCWGEGQEKERWAEGLPEGKDRESSLMQFLHLRSKTKSTRTMMRRQG